MSDLTEQRLRDALQRLIDGQPIYTKPDGKISLKRINDEAKLSQGAIYYYKAFVAEAREAIDQYKESGQINNPAPTSEPLSKEKKLRNDRDNEKRLKDEYRQQLANNKIFTDEIVKENVSLAYRVLELENQINLMHSDKVVSIKK